MIRLIKTCREEGCIYPMMLKYPDRQALLRCLTAGWLRYTNDGVVVVCRANEWRLNEMRIGELGGLQ